MSFLNAAASILDRLSGLEHEASKPDSPEAQALVRAGLALIDQDFSVEANTPLSEIADASTLLEALANLEAVYFPNHSLGHDIITNVAFAELITHLDAAKVSQVI